MLQFWDFSTLFTPRRQKNKTTFECNLTAHLLDKYLVLKRDEGRNKGQCVTEITEMNCRTQYVASREQMTQKSREHTYEAESKMRTKG